MAVFLFLKGDTSGFWILAGVAIFLLCKLEKTEAYAISSEMLVIANSKGKLKYVELYHIVDYEEESKGYQNLFGLKTISLTLTTSRKKIEIKGVLKEQNVVPFLRERVERQKLLKRVNEI